MTFYPIKRIFVLLVAVVVLIVISLLYLLSSHCWFGCKDKQSHIHAKIEDKPISIIWVDRVDPPVLATHIMQNTVNKETAHIEADNPIAKQTASDVVTKTVHKKVVSEAVQKDNAGADVYNSSRWAVQLASFSEQENAVQLVSRLKNLGYPSFIRQQYNSGNKIAKVLVGPLADRLQAKEVLEKCRVKFDLTGYIVKYKG
jgi:cell division septation protein DedD